VAKKTISAALSQNDNITEQQIINANDITDKRFSLLNNSSMGTLLKAGLVGAATELEKAFHGDINAALKALKELPSQMDYEKDKGGAGKMASLFAGSTTNKEQMNALQHVRSVIEEAIKQHGSLEIDHKKIKSFKDFIELSAGEQKQILKAAEAASFGIKVADRLGIQVDENQSAELSQLMHVMFHTDENGHFVLNSKEKQRELAKKIFGKKSIEDVKKELGISGLSASQIQHSINSDSPLNKTNNILMEIRDILKENKGKTGVHYKG